MKIKINPQSERGKTLNARGKIGDYSLSARRLLNLIFILKDLKFSNNSQDFASVL